MTRHVPGTVLGNVPTDTMDFEFLLRSGCLQAVKGLLCTKPVPVLADLMLRGGEGASLTVLVSPVTLSPSCDALHGHPITYIGMKG